jgi:ubiquinone/menaquinone biosynthesis C-methylase UbiE
VTVDRLRVPPGSRVLDVGAARGVNSSLLSANHQVIALEIMADLASVARSALPDEVLVVRADVGRLPFRESSFGCAILLEVFEHLADTRGALAELHRVLEPGGHLTLALPTAYTERLYSRLHPRYVANSTHDRVYEREEVEEELRRAGFRVEAIASHNFDAALKWVLYALFRVDSDHTGALLGGLWVERGVNGLLKVWRRIPVLRRVLRTLETRIGKSWYFYCVHH